jgi:hypothetical protein
MTRERWGKACMSYHEMLRPCHENYGGQLIELVPIMPAVLERPLVSQISHDLLCLLM